MKHESVIELYGTEYCPYCTAARLLLKKKGMAFKDISVSTSDSAHAEMKRRSGGRSVPQIMINNQPIGGFDDLNALEQSGELDQLLAVSASNDQE